MAITTLNENENMVQERNITMWVLAAISILVILFIANGISAYRERTRLASTQTTIETGALAQRSTQLDVGSVPASLNSLNNIQQPAQQNLQPNQQLPLNSTPLYETQRQPAAQQVPNSLNNGYPGTFNNDGISINPKLKNSNRVSPTSDIDRGTINR
jgi:type II secretory pathway pseudopilin PulG